MDRLKKMYRLALAGGILLGSLFGFSSNSSAADHDTRIHANRSVSASYRVMGKKLIHTANRYLGVKYQFGAEYETSRRFDCSSFTQYIFKKHGIRISRGARSQFRDGIPVSRSNLKPGDLVFFSTPETWKYHRNSIKRIGHVGIYAGKGRVLHTYGQGGVRYSTMSRGWWNKNYVGAVRVIK